MSEEWASPIEGGGEFIKIGQLAGHLIIAYPIGYIEHLPTKFSTPDKRSDAIACDIVDLDVMDENGQPGKIYRNQRLMQGQVIAALRPRIGGRVLGRVTQGISRNGMNPPWQIQDATKDPDAIARATAWVQVHADFVASEFVAFVPRQQPAAPQFQQAPTQQYQQPQYGGYPQQAPAQQPQFGGYPQAPQQQPQYGGYPPAQPPQFQQAPPAYSGQGYDVGPSPQGPPPEWATPPPAQIQQQPVQYPQAAPQAQAPTPMVPAVGVARQVTPAEASVLERLRRQREAGQYDQGDERQRFGF